MWVIHFPSPTHPHQKKFWKTFLCKSICWTEVSKISLDPQRGLWVKQTKVFSALSYSSTADFRLTRPGSFYTKSFQSHCLIPVLRFASECLCIWPIPWNKTLEADVMPSQHHHQSLHRVSLKLNYHFWDRSPNVISQLSPYPGALPFLILNVSHLLSLTFPSLMFPSKGASVRERLNPAPPSYSLLPKGEVPRSLIGQFGRSSWTCPAHPLSSCFSG